MALEHYLRSGSRMLRCGFTTGTCASLAASGAAQLLLTGVSPSSLSLLTPKGLTVEVEPVLCRMEGDQAVCAIRKDAGDDGAEDAAAVKPDQPREEANAEAPEKNSLREHLMLRATWPLRSPPCRDIRP